MLRPTKAQIDAGIIDHAAALFAQHGFAHTSLQQIADAVGYSKAGLLHHFPSKKAIYDAAIQTLREDIEGQLARVKDMPVGIERDRSVIEAAVNFGFDHPGISALGNRMASNPDDSDPDLTAIGFTAYEALGIDLDKLTPERIVRVSVAFSGLSLMAAQVVRHNLPREWRVHIVESAMNALGH